MQPTLSPPPTTPKKNNQESLKSNLRKNKRTKIAPTLTHELLDAVVLRLRIGNGFTEAIQVVLQLGILHLQLLKL